MLQRNLTRHVRQATNAWIHTRPVAASTRQPYYVSSTFSTPTRIQVMSRWYSGTAQRNTTDESLGQGSPTGDEPTVEKSAQSSQNNTNQTSSQEANPLQKELDAKTKEVLDFKDKYLRQVAEYRNLQERTRREIQAAKDFALQRFAKDLVESIDTFDLALASVPADRVVPVSEGATDVDKDLRSLYGGLKMTETVLMNTLKKHGLERFDPSENGDKFDPNLHDAVFQTPQPDKTDGTVFHTTQKGFMLNGRVLRAAKVGVVKNS